MLTALTAAEEKIMEQVGIFHPREYGLLYRDESTIRLLHYLTRDVVTINRGDRPWPKE